MKPLEQNHVRYGLLMSGFIALCLLSMYLTNDYSKMQTPSLFGTIITIGAPLVIYTLGIWSKKKLLGNKLTFKQGLREGFKISLVAGVTSPFVFLVFYIFFNPYLIEYARNAYQMNGYSDGAVVSVDLLVQFIGSVIFGTIIGGGVSIFLKNKSGS